MTFTYAISIGDIIATLSLLVVFFAAVYKIVANHLSHMETRLTTQITRVSDAQDVLNATFIRHIELHHS